MVLTCRFCGSPLDVLFADLGLQPNSNAFVDIDDPRPEALFPLRTFVCGACFLVQTEDMTPSEVLFSAHYAYFSSYSQSWLDHVRTYADRMIEAERLGPASRVVEIASNDGYLLQYFVEANIPCLGVEPTPNTARAAFEERGVPSEVAFFGAKTAQRLLARDGAANLMIANNVLAHVPNINDFIAGFKILLAPDGLLTVEFPHLLKLIQGVQFDTIYHEHFSYLSLGTAMAIFAQHGLKCFDVESLTTHGGSLRLHIAHTENVGRPMTPAIEAMRQVERCAGLTELSVYRDFGRTAARARGDLRAYLLERRAQGARVAGYGAPAKGVTLLNYCGVGPDLLEFTVDLSPHKIGKRMPGVAVPIHSPERLLAERPDDVLVLPWNLIDEIVAQMGEVRGWGGRFVTPIPSVKVIS